MKVKFTCKNSHYFEKTEEEIKNTNQPFRYCFCGEKLSVQNIEEIVILDIQNSIVEHTTNRIVKLGLEGFVEAVEHLQDGKIKELYREELKRRGIKWMK